MSLQVASTSRRSRRGRGSWCAIRWSSRGSTSGPSLPQGPRSLRSDSLVEARGRGVGRPRVRRGVEPGPAVMDAGPASRHGGSRQEGRGGEVDEVDEEGRSRGMRSGPTTSSSSTRRKRVATAPGGRCPSWSGPGPGDGNGGRLRLQVGMGESLPATLSCPIILSQWPAVGFALVPRGGLYASWMRIPLGNSCLQFGCSSAA